MDNLLLALLLNKNNKSVSDEEYREIFRNREIKSASGKALLFLVVAILLSIAAVILTANNPLLNLFVYGISALLIVSFIGTLYVYLRSLIAQH